MGLCTLVQRNKFGIYEIRKRVPVNLQDILGKKTIKKSLGTSNPQEAKRLKSIEESRIQDLFDSKRAELTQKKRREFPGDPSIGDPTPLVSEADRLHMRDILMRLDVTVFENRLGEQHFTDIQELTGERHSWPPHKRKHVIQILDVMKDAFRGAGYNKQKIIQLHDLIYYGSQQTVSLQPALPQAGNLHNATDKGANLTLQDIFDKWGENKKRGAKHVSAAEVSISRHQQRANAFIKSYGNLLVGDISRDKIIDFREHLKTTELKNKTINNYVKTLRALLSFALDEQFIKSQPLQGKYTLPEDGSETRLPLGKDDFKKIFLNTKFRDFKKSDPTKFWIPLIALFTGMRLDEIGQLQKEDIKELDNIVYFDVNDSGNGKKVKTKSSIRQIPIHSELVKLGFLDYVKGLGDSPQSFLFPDLKLYDGRRTHGFSKWFGKYLRNVGVTDSRKVFHSFRHKFKDMTREATEDEEMRDALTGHSGSSIGRGYGGGFSIEAKHRVMQEIKSPVDLSILLDK